MPEISLDLGDAAEPAEMLTFLTGWLSSSQKPALADSLAAFAGHTAYNTDALRADLHRFAFLLGVSDGEELFGEPVVGGDPVPGTSIESDEYVRRADALRMVPAFTRFLSLEPLLGPLPSLNLTGIDWVIVGGESGPGHRPVDLGWVRGNPRPMPWRRSRILLQTGRWPHT
jgi:hypothetical protein